MCSNLLDSVIKIPSQFSFIFHVICEAPKIFKEFEEHVKSTIVFKANDFKWFDIPEDNFDIKIEK